jgi:hypothetical protein
MNYEKLIIEVSKTFLTEPLPDNWVEMEEAGLLAFIENHVWEPFENWSSSDLINQIEQTAMGVVNLINNDKEEAGESLMAYGLSGHEIMEALEIARVGAERAGEYIKHELDMSDGYFDDLIERINKFMDDATVEVH